MEERAVPNGRPVGIVLFCLCFAAGSAIALLAAVSLAFPGSFLEPSSPPKAPGKA